MNNAKDKFLAIVFIVLLIAFSVIILAGFALQLEVLGNYIEGLFALIAALIAVVGVSETIKSNQNLKNRELLNDLDQKSEWRKELMNVSSKTFMTTDDIYRVLASLRYLPKIKTDRKDDKNDFNHMTRVIYDELSSMLNNNYKDLIEKTISKIKQNEESKNKENKNKESKNKEIKNKEIKNEEIKEIILSYEHTQIIRLYTKYLLKHHWEINIDENIWLKDQKEVIEEVKELRNKI